MSAASPPRTTVDLRHRFRASAACPTTRSIPWHTPMGRAPRPEAGAADAVGRWLTRNGRMTHAAVRPMTDARPPGIARAERTSPRPRRRRPDATPRIRAVGRMTDARGRAPGDPLLRSRTGSGSSRPVVGSSTDAAPAGPGPRNLRRPWTPGPGHPIACDSRLEADDCRRTSRGATTLGDSTVGEAPDRGRGLKDGGCRRTSRGAMRPRVPRLVPGARERCGTAPGRPVEPAPARACPGGRTPPSPRAR